MKKIKWWTIDGLGGISDEMAFILSRLEIEEDFIIEKDIVSQKIYVWYLKE